MRSEETGRETARATEWEAEEAESSGSWRHSKCP